MWNTPTQQNYRPNIAPRLGRRATYVPPRHQAYGANYNGYIGAQATGTVSSTTYPSVGYHNSGSSAIRPYRSQNMPLVNNGYIQPIVPATQHATPDSGSESDTSVEQLWSPATGSSAISSTTAESTIIADCYDDTDSEDEEDVVLNDTMHRHVRAGVDIFYRDGLHVLIGALINFGTSAYASAGPTAIIARSIIRRLRLRNEVHARDLQNYLRFEAVRIFKDYWLTTGEWNIDKVRNSERPYLTLKGVNLAGLLGSLFRVDIVSGDDVHLCLTHVAANVAELHPLCAIHALVIHSGKKLCRRTLFPETNRFWALMSTLSPYTGRYIWAFDSISFELLMDIFGTLDRWLATQTLKQIRAASDPVKIAKRKKKTLAKTNP